MERLDLIPVYQNYGIMHLFLFQHPRYLGCFWMNSNADFKDGKETNFKKQRTYTYYQTKYLKVLAPQMLQFKFISE